MKIDVSTTATNWYQKELDLDEETSIRFFVRYGGVGGLIPGFSIGINIEDMPTSVFAKQKVDKITYYISEEDAWYFEGKEVLQIELNKDTKEPQITYQ